jgi:squalene synthase HpnC
MNYEHTILEVKQASLSLASTHYENFPVASILLPKHLRVAIAMIYRFARQADDIADEGDDDNEVRLAKLQALRDELLLIQAYIQPNTIFFRALKQTITEHELPLEPFFNLLDAFSQDVEKTRYSDFNEVLAYCKLSANPIGQLLLHLYKKASPENIALSDDICTALQLINFYQDVAIDLSKHAGRSRIYLCQDEMQKAGISEGSLKEALVNHAWKDFMHMNIARAAQLLLQGKPLANKLPGRFGYELRMIVAGGEQLIKKLYACDGNVFDRRPTLNSKDWGIIITKALFRL